MLEKARIAAISGLLGALIAGVAVYVWTLPGRPPEPGKQPSDAQISGGPIYHTDWKTTGSAYTAVTRADAAGESVLTIPKDFFPESRYWLTKVNGITINAGLSLRGTKSVEALYCRRWGVISLGGGLRGEQFRDGQYDVAAVISGTFWF